MIVFLSSKFRFTLLTPFISLSLTTLTHPTSIKLDVSYVRRPRSSFHFPLLLASYHSSNLTIVYT